MLALIKLIPLAFSLVSGYKTYATLAIGAATVIGNYFGLQIPGVHLDSANWLSDLFTIAAGATLRHAVGKN